VWPDKQRGLHCIWFKMDNSFSTVLKHIKHPKEVETTNQSRSSGYKADACST
jgi:hypothetical protein